jgi:indolepyruvate ferredoxin oxidoreductase
MAALGEADVAQTARLASVTLDDKYTAHEGRVYLNGMQALTRLAIMQRQRDTAAGLNTAGYVTGYRGSPLGGLDQAMVAAKKHLQEHQITFQPGVNEDLAATAVWGTQQLDLFGDSRYDGVFGMWYGKGPGVDRCGDVFRHANLSGTARHGGVLVLAGDDHTCKSSTTAHQTEYAFMDYGIPVLNPANIQEFLDYGLYGWAASRYSGCWIAMKVVADNCDSSASVYVDPSRIDIRIPEDFELPEGGLNIRKASTPFITVAALEQEYLLHKYKLYAALAFARANKLNKVMIDGPNRRFGIVTCGKTYMDVRQALDDLGIDDDYARRIGLSLYKIGMTWPLEREGVRHFAEGLEEILVVEEKRALMENQLKEQLYNWKESVRPKVVGKFDESGEWILPSADELTPARIARVIAKRIARFHTSPAIEERLKFLEAKERALTGYKPAIRRVAYFCSGCPHNTSTKVPEGSRALAGIGCHIMANWMDRSTETFTQMGGEGATWIGQAPFSKTGHVFQNLGDGTYYHSGLLAIRAAVAAGVNITYKILVNDAIAMTGGQVIEGQVRVDTLTRQVHAEGVRRIAVVSNNTDQYRQGADFADGVTLHHRDDLDAVQRELREIAGVSVIVYDQHCATELRRRRKRGSVPDPDQRTFINQRVCEGCGDCSVQSNCIAIEPVETAFGRKRRINQSACNKDFSCLKGYCPSFVTVRGATPRRRGAIASGSLDIHRLAGALPLPGTRSTAVPYSVLITGIGGSGVVTLGALLGMAAHLEGQGCSVLDVAGLAQRNGPVTSHIRIADTPEQLHATRIAAADLIIGSDIVVTAGRDVIARIYPQRTRAVVNSHVAPTSAFASNPDLDLSAQTMQDAIATRAGAGAVEFVAATELAYALLGNEVAANLFLVGYALQRGWLPITLAALERAIVLNGVAVEMNRASLAWGRLAAHDLATVQRSAGRDAAVAVAEPEPENLAALVERNAAELALYQDAAYAQRYRQWVERARRAEQSIAGAGDALALAVARYYFKLLAYKDEYEVARLYSAPEFMARLREEFEGDFSIEFNMAPPLLQRRDPSTGRYRKRTFGPWMLHAFKWLARLKRLRGTRFDPLGYSHHRRMERQLIEDYEQTLDSLLQKLDADNHDTAVEIAALPEFIRGYDIVKERNIEQTRSRREQLLARFHRGRAAQRIAAEVLP